MDFNIKKERKLAGMTQAELSHKVGVSKGTLWLWENGRKSPSASNHRRLEKIFMKNGYEKEQETPNQPYANTAISLITPESFSSRIQVLSNVNVVLLDGKVLFTENAKSL